MQPRHRAGTGQTAILQSAFRGKLSLANWRYFGGSRCACHFGGSAMPRSRYRQRLCQGYRGGRLCNKSLFSRYLASMSHRATDRLGQRIDVHSTTSVIEMTTDKRHSTTEKASSRIAIFARKTGPIQQHPAGRIACGRVVLIAARLRALSLRIVLRVPG